MRYLYLGLILGIIAGDIAYKLHLWSSLTAGEKAILENSRFLKIPALEKGHNFLDDPVLIAAGVALVFYFIYYS